MHSIKPVTHRTPAECFTAEVECDGLIYSLVLTRQYYRREGQASLEVVTATRGGDGEPLRTEFLDGSGEWKVVGHDEGPSELVVDLLLPEDLSDPDPVIDALLGQLFEQLGADTYRSWS